VNGKEQMKQGAVKPWNIWGTNQVLDEARSDGTGNEQRWALIHLKVTDRYFHRSRI
jgi:hypothetical protein